MTTFIIAEAGSSHDNDLSKAYRLIEAAKECGADAVKFQYWSSSKALARRRGIPEAEAKYEAYRLPTEWIEKLHYKADQVGIEWMCTTYLIEDIAVIATHVKRFKVSAFEAGWEDFIRHHMPYKRQTIISVNPGLGWQHWMGWDGYDALHCISKYPTPIKELELWRCRPDVDSQEPDSYGRGLSDHTANILTGAAAVAAGAKIIEAHIRLSSTDKSNPDYGHSLLADCECYEECFGPGEIKKPHFKDYVQNIRTVERML